MQAALKARVVPCEVVFFDRRQVEYSVERKYTYADMLGWPEDDPFTELFNGMLRRMPPASIRHQIISFKLSLQIGNFLTKNPLGIALATPGVRLDPRADNSDTTVLIPDLIVVKDVGKLDKQSCNGAPDLIIEILSPSSVRYDLVQKRGKYELACVSEYWVVDPERNIVTVHLLRDGSYAVAEYGAADLLSVAVLPGCVVNLREVFGA